MPLLDRGLNLKRIKLLSFVAALSLAQAVSAADDRRPAEWASRATQAISEGNKNLAIYYYTQALLRDPSQVRWREWVAQAHMDRGDTADALRHAKLVLKAQPANARAKAIVEKLSKAVTSSTGSEDDLAKAEKAATTLPFPDKSSMVLPAGSAAWVVGNPADHVQAINGYNQSTAKSQQIRYIFIECGKIAINSGKVSLQFDPQPALQLAENLIGDVWVMPLIGGRSRGADRVSQAEWERVGRQVAQVAEQERRIAGIYFEVEPLKSALNPLFAFTKKHTSKPVAAGGIGWDPLAFKYTDFLVLKAFGYSTDMKIQSGQLRSNSTAFLKDARVMEGKGFIGLPGVAATQEYEEKTSSPGKDGLRSGKTMNAYFSNGLGWVRRALVESDPAFMGIALWAFYSGDYVHGEYDAAWFKPTKLDPNILEKLKLPVERE